MFPEYWEKNTSSNANFKLSGFSSTWSQCLNAIMLFFHTLKQDLGSYGNENYRLVNEDNCINRKKSCVSNKCKGFLGRIREDKISGSQDFDAKFCRGSARPPPNTNWSCSFVFFTKLCRPYSLKLEYLHSYKHPHHGVLDLHAVMEFPMQRSWPAAVWDSHDSPLQKHSPFSSSNLTFVGKSSAQCTVPNRPSL